MESISLEQLGIIIAAGACVGWLAGLFGVGGGFLLVPTLTILVGVPVEFAVGANACQVLGPSTTSLLVRKIERRDLPLPLTIAGGIFLGVGLGASTFRLLAGADKIQLAGATVSPAELIVLTIYLLLMLLLGAFSLWETGRANRGEPLPLAGLANWRIPPLREFSEFDEPLVSLPVIAWFGLGVGFLSGLLGLSGGFILIPGLIYLLGVRAERAIKTTLIVVWMISFQATIVHAWNGFVDLKLVASLLVGGTLGAQLGSRAAQAWGGRKLRQRFGWLLLASATMIVVKFVRMFF